MFNLYFFFFKQKTAYEMRISDWSSDVCSSDLRRGSRRAGADPRLLAADRREALHQAVAARDAAQPHLLRRDGHGDLLRLRERHPDAPQQPSGVRADPPDEPAVADVGPVRREDRKSTRLNSSHACASRMTSSA